MKKILVILFCITIGLTVSNPAWAHGGGGGGGGGGGCGAGGAGEGGNGGGEGGSHGGGEGHGGGMGHGAGRGLGHSDADDTISSRSTQFAGQKGATHHGRGVATHSRSSHLTASHHSLAHHHFVHSSKATVTPDVDTPAEKALPPGRELNVDRGKLLVPGNVSSDKDVEHPEPAPDDSEGQ